jgi:hypothetical protein
MAADCALCLVILIAYIVCGLISIGTLWPAADKLVELGQSLEAIQYNYDQPLVFNFVKYNR